MADMTQTVAPKSDQMNADDLIAGPRTITIREVRITSPGPEDQPVSVFYDGDNGKPFKPCLSMRRVMVAVWGNDSEAYIGQSMTLYRDPTVKFGGEMVGGIRISHMTGLSQKRTMALTATRAKRVAYTVNPLDMSPSPEAQEALRLAKEAAGKGVDAFRAWWGDEGRPHRVTLRPHLDELKRTAEAADVDLGPDTDADPFSDYAKPSLSPEDQQRILDEIAEENDRQVGADR